MLDNRSITGRYIGLFLLGCFGFSYPVLTIFNLPGIMFGIPLFFFYIFTAWSVLIVFILFCGISVACTCCTFQYYYLPCVFRFSHLTLRLHQKLFFATTISDIIILLIPTMSRQLRGTTNVLPLSFSNTFRT
jgi:hypothetical protein